jgi:glycosidase
VNKKIIIYQVLTRLFGNRNLTLKENGTIAENGVGKMNDFDATVLRRIHELGITHIWYTGVIRHASQTDYSSFGIPQQNPAVVKGKAGSPYAITDYYDIDPDIASNVNERMEEFVGLVSRTHRAGMKVIIDFVPNHVAREYHSIKKPLGVKDLGEDDNTNVGFSPQNNFYYCPGKSFEPYFDKGTYEETPAKATGNDRFDNKPGTTDWYETVKLNYGVDYRDGHHYYFDPIPSTWIKMTEILLFWASKGVDGFRCDMAEMVPHEFWAYATRIVKELHPKILFIGEVYDTAQYHTYIASGFDFLYDKVGMYDCLRGVICGNRPVSSISYLWQSTDDIHAHLLYFLENHDEQRIASDFVCGNGRKAIPALLVSALMRSNPFMLYAGQEYGERGMDKEGFSGIDGRTSIFDYWTVKSIYKGYFDHQNLSEEELFLEKKYQEILKIANREPAIREGEFFDLMYVNPSSDKFNPHRNFTFLRKSGNEVLLIIVNFSEEKMDVEVKIPEHAFDYLNLTEQEVKAVDLLTEQEEKVQLHKDGYFPAQLEPYDGRIYKFKIKMKESEYELNDHNKEEFPPAHTAEHLLNQVMIRMFGCERSNNAHIERKKSKMSFTIDHKPTRQEEKAIEQQMNQLIEDDLPVTYEYVSRNSIPDEVKLDRLPNGASDTIRLVRIGDFDVCPCIGKHVRSTAQIGHFEMLGSNWDEPSHSFRVRFKITQ